MFILYPKEILHFSERSEGPKSRKRFIILSRAKRVDPCSLSGVRTWLAHLYIFVCLNIYITHFGMVSASSVTSCSICSSCSWFSLCFIHVLSSVKEIFILSVNHKQIPSVQMTHKSKHSDSGFKKWIQILTRENFSGATSDHEMKFSASNKEDNNKNRNKKPRSLCPAKKPSTTDWGDQGRGYSSYRHIKTAVIAVFFCCL